MRKPVCALAALLLSVGLVGASPPSAGAAQPTSAQPGAAPSTTPRWLTHVQNFPGGISGGVRAQADPQALAARSAAPSPDTAPVAGAGAGGNRQINSRDSNPPLPQNETAVAVSLDDPDVAVAVANDYVSGGVVVMRTLDGARTWTTTQVVPVFAGTRDTCSGGDPSVQYSRRDHVFYLSQLCFFRTLAFSEVQIYVSSDNGLRWTPGRQAAVAASNFDYVKGTVDDSVFNDKELIAVDNTPGSPHYGRLYVTYTKFHMRADGFSDYCPLQLSFTDRVNATNPQLTTFRHTAISPDNPGGNGTGRSANQFSYPVVEPDGSLDVGFTQEECNSSADPHLLFQRSSDGGRTFLPRAVQIDKPGQYRDNPDLGDLLAPTAFRAPNTISMTYSSGKLTYAYQNNIHRKVSGADISFQQSGDNGRNWSDSTLLSTSGSAAAPNDQFMPSVTSLPGGRVYAIWYDRRLDKANHDIDTWQARSADNGRSWTSSRLSTTSWNPDTAFFTSGAFIGDYLQVAVSSTHVYPVWTDGRNSAFARTGIGETDIFSSVSAP